MISQCSVYALPTLIFNGLFPEVEVKTNQTAHKGPERQGKFVGIQEVIEETVYKIGHEP